MSTLSVQLYSVRDAFAEDPSATLAKLAEIGFTNVEPFKLVENASALRALREHGLSAPTTHVSLVGAELNPVFDAAAELGVTTLIDPFIADEKWRDAGDIAATADALNAAAEAAKGHGLTVGYHNHWWELANRVDGRAALEVLTDHLTPDVVLEVDTYWAAAGGEDAPALLRRLGERVVALHVKDGGLATDATGQVPAGQGSVPVADVLASAPNALRVVEFDAYSGDLFEGIAASRAFLLTLEDAK
ncbi:sugar phosphate isomerase/epimerase [Actinosynnema pretiosum subsp. pretiosum]|uniref:Xylose isomerase domain protein TIM barrel n=2 Tax=Actinosynnema TaxID=40566 RepID=C6WRQ0_ACTMD|nr:sugar phosphate isomerase/epimerase [Actinosynnema mirum]ACU36892.1 Xylose isomerase domain protein TIM barrel [Actinosynnema mirum DSM 43827]AXX30361.1 Xylose isomerase domain protein TIM barrel [Actinosynnema pretiosum subsp. pretiosum]QUF05490.1 sugar phosphate isomerase/epimerase [Actinosynnema pretiosum subsp. pretiosum]